MNNKQQNNGDKTFVGVEPQVIPPLNTIENIDCMEMLKKCPDKHFDLAIVDPPYGSGQHFNFRYGVGDQVYKNEAPPVEYFDELFRASKNQIIWGGNYFTYALPVSRCWITWNKKQPLKAFSDFELAWTNFDRVSRSIDLESYGFRHGDKRQGESTIHPTQKPVLLYKEVLKIYARRGDLILDTHVGSGSSIVACIEGGFNYYGCEIDKDYYNAAQRRIARAFRKYELFENEAE